MNQEILVKNIMKRYQGMTEEAVLKIFAPTLIPVSKMAKNVFLMPGQQHYRASFQIEIKEEYASLIVEGRMGTFVPASYVEGEEEWKAIARGRIINVDQENKIAYGEILSGNTKEELEAALEQLGDSDYYEIDPYEMTDKVTNALIEYNLEDLAKKSGYKVTRIPEGASNQAGQNYNYSFEFEKDGVVKRIQLKSIWTEDTRYARLIHTKSNRYLTSNCKFETQDIFAVSLYPRTGRTTDFAFAKSVSNTEDPVHGLPQAPGFVGYVVQNPICEVDNVIWFDSLEGVWEI